MTSNKSQSDPNLPPSYDELIIELAEELSMLTSMFRVIAEGLQKGDHSKKIGYDLDLWWHFNRKNLASQQERSSQAAISKEVLFGSEKVGDRLREREYLHQILFYIYSDMINALPTLKCKGCGKDIFGGEGHYCLQCNEVYCIDCLEVHSCYQE